MMPACVAVPRDEADCVAAAVAAGRCGVPVTPRGGATSLSGQAFDTGLVLDVSKYLNPVLEVDVVGTSWTGADSHAVAGHPCHAELERPSMTRRHRSGTPRQAAR